MDIRNVPTARPAVGLDHSADPSVWELAPWPVLVVGADRTIVALNGAADDLLPEVRVGGPVGDLAAGWLRSACLGPSSAAPRRCSGAIGARSYDALPAVAPGGQVVWWIVDATERLATGRMLRTQGERIAFLAEASNSLLSSLNVERCAQVTVRLAADHLADAVVLVNEVDGAGTDHLLLLTSGINGVDGTPGVRVAADPAEVPGLSETLQGFPPVPSRWLDPGALPGWAVPAGFDGPIGSIVVTPLPGHGVPAGGLILLRRSGEPAFDEAEEVLVRIFAARAGAALSAARMYTDQAQITRTVLAELQPPTLHQVHGVEFAGGYQASQHIARVGGDFYDVHPGPDAGSETLVVLGDVCGRGLDAAVLASKIRSMVHALLPMADDHQRFLRLLNSALLTTERARFASMVLASVRRTGPNVRLRLTRAGHPPPLIVRSDGAIEEILSPGSVVGATGEITTTTRTVELRPGDTCLLYTDGVTEVVGGPIGGEAFGEQRLRAALTDCAGMPSEAVVERVMMLSDHWAREIVGRDDAAVVAITAPRATSSTPSTGTPLAGT